MPRRFSLTMLVGIALITSTVLFIGGPLSVQPALSSSSRVEKSTAVPPGGVANELSVRLRAGHTSNELEGIGGPAGAHVTATYARSRQAVMVLPSAANAAALLTALRHNPAVEEANYRMTFTLASTPNDPGFASQWNLKSAANGISAPAAWDLATRRGQGVTVAVLDTGIAYEDCQCPGGWFKKVPDLAGKTFVSPWDFVNGDTHANDDNGHGTLVTGVLAEDTDNGYGYAGVAPGAAIMPLKVLDLGGQGSAPNLVEGIYYAVDHGARVLNMSVVFPGTGAADVNGTVCTEIVGLNAALDYAFSHGATVVAASGNSGTTSDNVFCPGAYPSVISVAATTASGMVPMYSNKGAALDVTAPGGDSTVPITQEGYCSSWSQLYATKSYDQFCAVSQYGTSFATPHVAGIAALLLAEHPSLTPADVSQIIRTSASDRGAAGWDPAYGWGLVDANDAVTLALGPAPTPTVEPTATPIPGCATDSDGDGMPDCFEIAHPCLNSAVADANADPDADGLSNATERERGTDPCARDTDADGCGDGTELGPDPRSGGARNPLNGWDFFDVTGDRKVDAIDISIVRVHYTLDASAPELRKYDRSPGAATWAPNGPNGKIDSVDFSLVRAEFGHSC